MLEQVRQFLRQKPFRPFRIVMRSGERHEIDDCEKIAVGFVRAHWFPKGSSWIDIPEAEIELVYEPRMPRRAPNQLAKVDANSMRL